MRDFAVHRATSRKTNALRDTPIFERFLDVSPDAIVITDERGFVHYVNGQMEKLLGWAPPELVGRSVDVLVPERLRHEHALHRAEYVKAPSTRPMSLRELFALHKDGFEVPVAIGLSAVRTGDRTWVMATMRDDDEQKQSTLHLLGDMIPAGVIVTDARGTIVFDNAMARAILGGHMTGNARRPTGRFAMLRMDGSPIGAEDMPLVRALEHGETTLGDSAIIRRDDGTERIILTTATPELDRHGSVMGAIAVFQDISERERATRELEDRERTAFRERALFETILDSAGNPIVYVDATTGHLRANPEAEKLFGHPMQNLLGREQYADQLRFPDGHPVPFEELGTTRALRGETVTWQELLVVRPDGSEVPVLETAAPVIVGADVTGVVVVFQDITAMKQLARVREEWIAVIAHDLRQPITVITGYVKLLARMMGPTSTQVGRFFGHITTSAQQLNRMVEDLLDISRIEAHRLSLERAPIDLVALVRSVVDRSAEITRGHLVTVDVRGAIPIVDADAGRIEQVLGNLLSNAAKYGAPGSAIEVVVDACAAGARVAVRNRGRGIAQEDLCDLFKRFSRGRAARGGRVTGVGLGLYISKALVEAHGGTIDVESVPDEATTFRLTLPVRSS